MYTPRIPENLIRRLYKLKLKFKKPMTKIVREAVEEYLEKHETHKRVKKNS